MNRDFEVIVIGGGHAGAEAAWAASSVLGPGGRIALITMDPSKIGAMSCNPAIGGLAKGQMVREIDALGGLMGLAADATGIMFKVLNQSRGAAVRGPRAQCDKHAYAVEVQRLLATRSNICVIAGCVDDIVVEGDRAVGVVLAPGAADAIVDTAAIDHHLRGEALARPIFIRAHDGEIATTEPMRLTARAIVLTTGTFMRAIMHTGAQKTAGGRVNEGSAVGISHALKVLGFELGRLKTGTPPRLARESIDWDALEPQHGDAVPTPFSDHSPAALHTGRFPLLPQVECRVTRTTPVAHALIRANLHRAPMYAGQIEAECGPRYCPSIEDKVVRFADRESHHVFLEPESLHTNEIYCNGISTSLPGEIQEQIVRAMPGCANARILRMGYAVEYDMVRPHQIDATCMTKRATGLFLAGQINGTSGYEEAAGQGLIAGLNAALLARGREPIRLRRDQAYIGVMLDDLVTRTPREPYRMFTSRAEHRLHLRADNADVRLTELGRSLGLVDDHRWQAFTARQARLELLRALLDARVHNGRPLREYVRRPDVPVAEIAALLDAQRELPLVDRVVTEARYDGYIQRQQADIRRQMQAEDHRIPAWVEYTTITGLRAEAMEVLGRFRPMTMGQASRLAGVTPGDLSLLSVIIRRGPQASAAAR